MKRFLTILVMMAIGGPLCAPHAWALDTQSHLQAQLLPRLSADAAISCPEETEFPASITVKSLGVDANAVAQLLAPGKTPIDERQYEVDDNFGVSNLLTYDDGGFIVTTMRNIRFRTGTILCASQFCALGRALNSTTIAHPDLPFCTRAQADLTARALLAKLGLGDGLLLDACYAIPHEQLQVLCDEMVAAPHNKEALEDGVLLAKEKWTSADDCYYLAYSLELEGLRLETEPYISLDGSGTFSGTEIAVVVTQRGVEYLEAQELMQVLSTDTPAPVLSPDEALKLFIDKYEDILLLEDAVLKKMQLRYLSLPVPGETAQQMLVPVWRFYVPNTGDLLYTDASEWTTFNAITGQEM